jgi:hypothetical protein
MADILCHLSGRHIQDFLCTMEWRMKEEESWHPVMVNASSTSLGFRDKGLRIRA